MALGDKKISSVFNTGEGNAKTVSATQEARIKASFDDGTYIQDQGMLENLGPMIYGLQKVEEDIEELRRFVAAELTTYSANDISTWQRVYDRFHVGPQESTPEGIFFKPDGTKMYVVGRSGDDVDEYALSTAWDITTASYTDQLSGLNSSPASESNPTGIYMSPDGIYLYITGHSVDQIIQYTMSVAWDVSTATYTREQGLTYNSGSQLVNPDGIDFKSDGTMLFAISRDRDLIQSYNLSTAWDISTISEHQSFSLIDFFDYNVMSKPAGTSDISGAYDMRISQDGTKIWIVDSSYDAISQLDLSTPFDVTTSVYSGETGRITPYESLISGLYVAESVSKAFSISNSNDYVRTFNFGAPTFSTTNKASYSFLTGLGVKGDLTVSQGIINAAGLINTSSTYLYSTLETHGTSNLGHNNGGRVRLVNNNSYSYDSIIDMMTNLKWGTNTNTQSTQDNLNHSINIGRPHSGTKLTVNIGRSMLTDGAFRNHTGLVNVYSDAQFIDHKGRLKVGQNLQVDGVSFEQLEAYDLGGTIIFNDTFTESSDTNLDSHTPDTGAGWTLAYNTTSRTSQVKGGQGHLRMSGDDSGDGIFYLCDTLPTTQDYEVKVDWSRQDDSNDTLSIIIKYKDANNFLALQWSGSYDYCRLTKIQGGALSNIDPNTTNPFRYGVPTTTTDGQTGSIKLRFIDGKMMVWNIDPEGTISFRGSWDIDSNFHDNDGDGGTFYKFGLGFGEIFSTQGFDATTVWKITNFQVKQLSAASTFNAAQKHYINNGNFGVGITNPTSKFHVVGDARIQGNLTVNGTYTQIDTDVNTTEQWLVTNDGTGPAAVINQLGSQDIFDVQDDGTSVFYIEDGGNVGVGTTNPSGKLDVNGVVRVGNGGAWATSAGAVQLTYDTSTAQGVLSTYYDTTSLRLGAGISQKTGITINGQSNANGNNITFRVGNSDRVHIDSSGNVGIGTSSPDSKLHVYGTSNPVFKVEDDGGAWGFMQAAGSNQVYVGSGPSANLSIYAGLSSAMTILASNRNVGIGTSSPSQKLDVNGNMIANAYYVANTSNYIDIATGLRLRSNSDGIRFMPNGTDTVKFLANGNVGIGTTSPSYALDVKKDDASILHLYRPNSSTAASTNLDFSFNTADASQALYARITADVETNTNSAQGGDLSFHTANAGTISEVMRLTEDGNIGIGTTSPSHKLDVDGGAQFNTNTGSTPFYITRQGGLGEALSIKVMDDNIRFESIQDESNDNYGGFDFRMDGGTTEPDFVVRKNAGDPIFNVKGDGNVGIGTTSPAYKLDVAGTAQIQAATSAYLTFEQSSNQYQAAINSSNHLVLQAAFNNQVIFKDGGATNMVIDGTTSNVGIGTTTPTEKLHVEGRLRLGTTPVIASHDTITIDIDQNNNQADNYFRVTKDGEATELFRVQEDGNVGIGTTSPDAKLSVTSTTLNSEDIVYLKSGADNVDDYLGIAWELNIGGNGPHAAIRAVGGPSSGDCRLGLFTTSDGSTLTEGLSVAHNGNVGIGTTSPSNPLTVVGSDSVGIDDYILHNDDGNTKFGFPSNDTFKIRTAGSDRLNIDSSGNTTISGRADFQKDLRLRGTDAAANQGVVRFYVDSSNKLFIDTANDGSNLFAIDGSGNVGIGTVSPSHKLTVNGDLKLGDNDVIRIGDDSFGDLKIHHDGSNSYVSNFTGNLLIENTADNSNIIFRSDDGSGGVAEYFRLDGALGYIRFWKHARLEDNVELRVGTGNDLKIYHDGSNSFIDDVGTGKLRIRSNALQLEKYTGENMAVFNADGAASIYYDGSKKLETTSTGVEVTGNINVSGSVQRQISTTHHTININSSTGSSQDFWIPFIEKNEQPSPNVTHKTVAPYDGVLKKVIVHSTAAFASNAQIRFHKINNGAAKVFANDNSTDDVTTNVTADMSTAYTSVAFNFTSGNTFSAGDQIGLGIVRNNTAVGDVVITAVWEYELF